MPLTRRSLALPASPPSVKLARSWVCTVLKDIGRDDLIDAAQLGVSELVTNALIHSRPPLLVRMLGTVDHPRIEVVDSSPVPPQRAPVAPAPDEVDDFNLTNYGRGLDLVAMMSARWGADLGHDGRTKTVCSSRPTAPTPTVKARRRSSPSTRAASPASAWACAA